MTHEEKINYMRIATGIAGYGFEVHHIDLLVSLYELILQHKENTDVHHILKIELEVKGRKDSRTKSELLDKFSKKV